MSIDTKERQKEDKETENFLITTPQKNISTFNSVLKTIMSDYGFTERQQLGLLLLLKINAIDVPEDFASKKEANDWLKDNTQKLMRKGEERWSIENEILEANLNAKRDLVIQAATLLGMIEEIMPDFSKVKSFQAVIPGGLESRVLSRCNKLVEDIKEEHIPQQVILVTGERVLQDAEIPTLLGAERTEKIMCEAVWSNICKKNEINLPSNTIYAPKKFSKPRATTVDTVETLAADTAVIEEETIVVYIEQPFATRFLPIFKTLLKNKVSRVLLCAEAADLTKTPLFSFADELARRIFFQYPELAAKY